MRIYFCFFLNKKKIYLLKINNCIKPIIIFKIKFVLTVES